MSAAVQADNEPALRPGAVVTDNEGDHWVRGHDGMWRYQGLSHHTWKALYRRYGPLKVRARDLRLPEDPFTAGLAAGVEKAHEEVRAVADQVFDDYLGQLVTPDPGPARQTRWWVDKANLAMAQEGFTAHTRRRVLRRLTELPLLNLSAGFVGGAPCRCTTAPTTRAAADTTPARTITLPTEPVVCTVVLDTNGKAWQRHADGTWGSDGWTDVQWHGLLGQGAPLTVIHTPTPKGDDL